MTCKKDVPSPSIDFELHGGTHHDTVPAGVADVLSDLHAEQHVEAEHAAAAPRHRLPREALARVLRRLARQTQLR